MKELNEIRKLQIYIEQLEKENLYLKELLNRYNIDYFTDNQLLSLDDEFDENQGSRIIPEIITINHARLFFSFFWGRTDVYSKRSQNKSTGKAGYYTQCDNFWKYSICPKTISKKANCRDCANRRWTKLEGVQVENHLRGTKEDASDVIGVYPLFPDGICRFLVFDFDNHTKEFEINDDSNTTDNWKKEVDALREIGEIEEIPMLVERSRSGHGAHIWIFFDSPISASLARKFGFALLNKGAEYVNMTSFSFYDRMIPAQDSLNEGELGNLIALPLQGKALKEGNSAFIDKKWNAYPMQWDVLKNTKKLSLKDIEEKMNIWGVSINENSSDKMIELESDGIKPWKKDGYFHKEDVSGKILITLSNGIYVSNANLKPRLQNQIRKLAAYPNPEFFKNKAIGLSNYANSRYIYLGEDDNGYIHIPRGLLDTLINKLDSSGISFEICNEHSEGREIDVVFTGKLKESQIKAVNALSNYNEGILSAATSFGKTVVCANLIALKKVSTLIILESSALIKQWEQAISQFLEINEEPPKYITKSGRVKKREHPFGIIHGSKDTSTGIIDIAMAGSLYSKGEFHSKLKEYGMVIVDECHHSASATISRILQEIPAKYVYGVTATPFRGDGLEKINEMLLGPIRFKYTAKEKAEEQGINHYIIPRFTHIASPYGKDRLNINKAYELIRKSEARDKLIVEDVENCIKDKRTPVILTKFTDHANILYELLKDCADKVFLLTGSKTKKEQNQIRNDLNKVSKDETLILIATGQLIGEGFDYPRLDTLIMVDPVAWKGIVEQYAGRLNRDYDGKNDVIIYDYIDANIPVFDNMYLKRMKAYKRIGYTLFDDGIVDERKQHNSIFDFESYFKIFEDDMKFASKEIVISSPTLGKKRVEHMIQILRECHERGVKISIVTWSEEAYRYGRDDNRKELIEKLRNEGFNIVMVNDSCEHYAIMDKSIVWYGSINLLSRENKEDNIMRVISNRIADELYEMTFRKENVM